METTYELLGRAEEPSQLPDGPRGFKIYLEEWDGDGKLLGTVELPEPMLPERGRYELATFELELTFTDAEPENGTVVNAETATVVVAFRSEGEGWFRIDDPPAIEYGVMSLRRIHDESRLGGVPDWLLREDTDGYVTIDLEYDENATLERTRLDRADIEERRG